MWVREEEGEAPARVRAWWGGGWKRSSAAPPASPLFAHAAACTAAAVLWERSDGYTWIYTSLALPVQKYKYRRSRSSWERWDGYSNLPALLVQKYKY